jgi:hypothetical protein
MDFSLPHIHENSVASQSCGCSGAPRILLCHIPTAKDTIMTTTKTSKHDGNSSSITMSLYDILVDCANQAAVDLFFGTSLMILKMFIPLLPILQNIQHLNQTKLSNPTIHLSLFLKVLIILTSVSMLSWGEYFLTVLMDIFIMVVKFGETTEVMVDFFTIYFLNLSNSGTVGLFVKAPGTNHPKIGCTHDDEDGILSKSAS